MMILCCSDAPISELSLELLLLQVVLPSLLDQGHTRTWLKNLVTYWTRGVSWLLDLQSYLLGTVDITNAVSVLNASLNSRLTTLEELILARV